MPIDPTEIDFNRLCHEIYNDVYRRNQWDTGGWGNRYIQDAQRTQRNVEEYTNAGEMYLMHLDVNDNNMFELLRTWTSNKYKDLQDILRGGQRSPRRDDPKTLLFTVKKTLTRWLNTVGISYFFRRERRNLYERFFRGWGLINNFDARQMDERVLTDMSNLLANWNEVIYRSPRFSHKVIMYRGYSGIAANEMRRLNNGDRFTEHGFMSLSISYGIAQWFASFVEGDTGYVAAFEITPSTPICWIEPLSIMTNPREYEGLLSCGAVFEKIGRNYFRIVGYNRTRNTAQWLLQDAPGIIGRYFGFGDNDNDLLKKPDRKRTFNFSGNKVDI